jgi:hypothetical protein
MKMMRRVIATNLNNVCIDLSVCYTNVTDNFYV